MDGERRDRPLSQSRIHREGDIGGRHKLVHRLGERHRQTEAAKLLRYRNADPAALDQLPVGFLEALGRRDGAVIAPPAALPIADLVERREHVFAELGRLGEDRLHHVGRGVGKARQIGEALHVKDVVEQKQRVFHRRLVDRHGCFPSTWVREAVRPARLPVEPGTWRIRPHIDAATPETNRKPEWRPPLRGCATRSRNRATETKYRSGGSRVNHLFTLIRRKSTPRPRSLRSRRTSC